MKIFDQPPILLFCETSVKSDRCQWRSQEIFVSEFPQLSSTSSLQLHLLSELFSREARPPECAPPHPAYTVRPSEYTKPARLIFVPADIFLFTVASSPCGLTPANPSRTMPEHEALPHPYSSKSTTGKSKVACFATTSATILQTVAFALPDWLIYVNLEGVHHYRVGLWQFCRGTVCEEYSPKFWPGAFSYTMISLNVSMWEDPPPSTNMLWSYISAFNCITFISMSVV